MYQSQEQVSYLKCLRVKKRSDSNTRGDINLDTLHDENTTSNLRIPSVSENASAQQEKTQKKHSVAVDSEVRALTEDQQTYFADSKIRDEQGRLN